MKTSEIITAIIAAYGAIVSTIAVGRQLLSDRVKVKLTINRNMQVVGDPLRGGLTYTMIRCINVGRRPVTITSLGAIRLYPHLNFVAMDSLPQLPSQITEGQYITSMIDQAGLDFMFIDYWAAWDSHGGIHKKRAASLFKHWKSEFQLKRSFRRQRPSRNS